LSTLEVFEPSCGQHAYLVSGAGVFPSGRPFQ
jgi:hypothetical protein